MNKTYIILKELPSVKAGTEFVYSHGNQYRAVTCDNNFWDLPESVIIKYPDWFAEKLEKKYTEEDMRKCFEMSKSVDFKSGYNFASYQFKDFEDYLKYIKP